MRKSLQISEISEGNSGRSKIGLGMNSQNLLLPEDMTLTSSS